MFRLHCPKGYLLLNFVCHLQNQKHPGQNNHLNTACLFQRSGNLFLYLNKIFNFYFKPLKVHIFIKLIDNKVISARLIYNFFIRNLRTRKSIGRLVNFILSDITLQNNLLGFKVLTSGRFTRKERAFYKWISVKRSPLSTYNSMLDYFAGTYKSRFGICGIKIWLFKKIN